MYTFYNKSIHRNSEIKKNIKAMFFMDILSSNFNEVRYFNENNNFCYFVKIKKYYWCERICTYIFTFFNAMF